jgi:antitoxin (DNA-binding transcriptional repressor) of toxin-antitoxin stability system
MSTDRRLEVHARPADAHLHTDDFLDARKLDEFHAAVDAAGHGEATVLTDHGKPVAVVVPVELSRDDDRLARLAAGLLEMVKQPVAPRGREISRERWEVKVRAKLAEVFRLGMSAGWDKCAAVYAGVAAPRPPTQRYAARLAEMLAKVQGETWHNEAGRQGAIAGLLFAQRLLANPATPDIIRAMARPDPKPGE